MFDVGFQELVLVGIIALVVLGPERLPSAMRTVGMWVGKAKRTFNALTSEIDRELQIQELKQTMAQQKAQLEQQMRADPLQQLDISTPSIANPNHRVDGTQESETSPKQNHEQKSSPGQPNDESR